MFIYNSYHLTSGSGSAVKTAVSSTVSHLGTLRSLRGILTFGPRKSLSAFKKKKNRINNYNCVNFFYIYNISYITNLLIQ